jgi:hypothetical protein
VVTGTSVFSLALLSNFIWDCSVFHQLVEAFGATMCVLLITVMRKLAGQLKGAGTVVAEVTTAQKFLLGVIVLSCGVEQIPQIPTVYVRAVKVGCWFSLMWNGWYHYMRSNVDLGNVFKDISSQRNKQQKRGGRYAATNESKRRITSVERKNSQVKVVNMALRVKKRLRTNMQQLMLILVLGTATFIWWPQKKDGFGCALHTHDASLTVRLTLVSVAGVVAHAGLFHTIWIFRKKKRIAPANALARHGQSVRKMSIIEHLHAEQVYLHACCSHPSTRLPKCSIYLPS